MKEFFWPDKKEGFKDDDNLFSSVYYAYNSKSKYITCSRLRLRLFWRRTAGKSYEQQPDAWQSLELEVVNYRRQ